ncbi:MAG: hypothetical protein AABX47_08105 [Nanoarchaeota archaeon]
MAKADRKKESAQENKTSKEPNPIKTITFGIVLCWLLGVLLLAVAYQNLVHGMYLIGILVIIPSLAILPLTNIILRRYLHIELSSGLRCAIVIVSVAAIFYLAMPQPISPAEPNGYGVTGQKEYGVTDADGMVLIDIGDSTVAFVLRDQITGLPLEGINVALGMDPSEPWHATLAMQDLSGQYPLKLVELSGMPGGTQNAPTTLSAANGLAGSVVAETAPIEIIFSEGDFPYLRGAVDQKSVPGLQDPSGLPPGVNDLTKSLPDALQKLPGWAGIKATSKRVDATDMPRQIVQDYSDAMSAENIPGWVTTMVRGGSPVPGMLGEFTNSLSEMVFTKMGATEYDIVEIGSGPMSFKVYKPIFPEATGPIFPPAPQSSEFSITTAEGAQVSGGSIELMSKTTMGEGFVGVLDSQGKASIPVPIGDYTATVLTPGNSPKRLDLPVKEEGGRIPLKVFPRKPVTIELSTEPPLSSRMSLPEGTTRKITMIVRDAKGNVLSQKEKSAMKCTYFVRNPVGGQVTSVDRNGMITMGADQGAASITARCNGVMSKPMLISGSGERKKPDPAPKPIEPDTPDVPNPPANLPAGFPTNLPQGDYRVTVKVCATMIGCISQSGGIMRNTDPAEFARAISNALNQWMRAMQQGDCQARVSYSPFDGRSFAASGVGACIQGGQRADVNIQLIMQKT